MSLNVGELVGYLRLDMGDFDEKLAGAQAQADKLDSKNVDVKVKADTAVAEEKLAAVAVSEDAVASTARARTSLASWRCRHERADHRKAPELPRGNSHR